MYRGINFINPNIFSPKVMMIMKVPIISPILLILTTSIQNVSK
ncbi:hypothetical protein [Bacillus sp. REN16]|nr:hypothetical protein [Bacillus sp. REN16]